MNVTPLHPAPAPLTSARGDEFPAGAAEWPAGLNRREFVQRMGASLALAGLAGCARPFDQIVPRVASPESAGRAPGEVLAFATAVACEGFARGILVTARDGRPTKIEGNPDHPESLGATDACTQAAILSLYDPDRSGAPRYHGRPATWQDFEAAWSARRAVLSSGRGAGLVLLTEPTTSPTIRAEIQAVLDTYPSALWFQHTPLARHDHRGGQPNYNLAETEVILTLESDCLYQHPAALRYGRALARRRRVTGGETTAPRFYAMESSPTVTGSLADFRLPVGPGRQAVLLNRIAQVLDGGSNFGGLSPGEERFARALVRDVREHPGRVACIAGAECAADVHDWAAALNRRCGAAAVTEIAALRSDGDPRCAGDLAALSALLDRGRVTTLCLLGGNPAYASPATLEIARKFGGVPLVVHLGEYLDETAAVSHWHLPESHFLEAWSDLRSYSGVASVVQPVIRPLHDSRSMLEILRLLRGAPASGAYEIVREHWRNLSAGNFDARWDRWLAQGVVDEPPVARLPASAPEEFPRLTVPDRPLPLTLVYRPDPTILDGRHANNAWLQELPKPLTQLVWENAALVSAAFAAGRGLANGDVVTITANGGALNAPVWIMPGQADDVITLFLGYGRTHAGTVGTGLGYNAFQIRAQPAPWQQPLSQPPVLAGHRALVSTQHHFNLEGRDLVRVVTPAEAGVPRPTPAVSPPLFPSWKRGRYAWGMSIDLGTCLGCNACIVACQAENNIPVVGREQVARGREMHWIRVDRYVTGDASQPRFFAQPVPCMQCENAPCEVVCPVGATVHSSEGLNDMVYNRCVGTRYCSNNCPYKVRRFNFFDYRAARSSPLHLQENPEVTVRERGVMEKCTYCVQRINAARITAEKEDRAVRDGEIRTACQQACPAEAIVFGDLNDPASRVSRRKAEAIDYALLAELNTRPRTTYLAAVRHASDR